MSHHALSVLGWTVVVSLGVTTAAALAHAALCAWRPTGPARRHDRAALALFASLLLCAVSPAFLTGSAAPLVPLRAPASEPVPAALISRETTPRPAPAVGLEDAYRASIESPHPFAATILGLLAFGWAIGCAALLLRLAGGLFVASGLVRRARRVGAGRVLSEVGALRARCGLSVDPVVLQSAEVGGPAVHGWRKPTLLLPEGFEERAGVAALGPLLAHELAHVARQDYVVGLGQRLAEALLWHCPGARWLSTRLSEAREQACDDAAVSLGADARSLAAALGTLAAWPQYPASGGLAAAAPDVAGRVRRLLGERCETQRSPGRLVGLAVAALLALGASATLAEVGRAHAATTRPAATPAPPIDRANPATPEIPMAFGIDQPGAPLRVTSAEPSAAGHVFGRVSVRNVSEATISSARFAAWVENPAPDRRLVQVIGGDPIPLRLAPGQLQVVTLDLVTRDQARKLEASFGGFAQATLVLTEVELDADGDGEPDFPSWRAVPRDDAEGALEALHVPEAGVSRGTLRGNARDPRRFDFCRDDAGRPFSRGAVVPVVDGEAGDLAHCTERGWELVGDVEGGWELPRSRSGPEELASRGYAAEGMDEKAAGHIFIAAGIVSGRSGFDVHWNENGRSIGMGYAADPWFFVDEPDERWVPDLELEARCREWFAFLRGEADGDASGSVDTAEALWLRTVVEIGLAIDRLPELASLRALDRDLFNFDVWPAARQRVEPLRAYATLQARSEDAGLSGLPRLPPTLKREIASATPAGRALRR